MSSCAALLLVPLLLVAAERAPGRAQEPEADAAAAEQWRRTLAASRRGGDAAEPITAFRLHADVLTRVGVQSNESDVDLAYLAPDRIRFTLPGGKEVGRTGSKRREHWLRSSGRVVALTSREHEEDRRQIRLMLAVARSFIALSDPARLEVSETRLLPGPPSDLPRSAEIARTARRLAWLGVTSRGLDVGDGRGEALRIELGLETRGEEADLPRLAIVRSLGDGGEEDGAPPMLLDLGDYAELDGFRVPHRVLVHPLDPGGAGPRFAEKPAQEIYLLSPSSLRPALTAQDFEP